MLLKELLTESSNENHWYEIEELVARAVDAHGDETDFVASWAKKNRISMNDVQKIVRANGYKDLAAMADQFRKNRDEVSEARQPDVTYTAKEVKGKIEKLTVTLESSKSADFTKLARRYKDLMELTEQLKIKQDELNAETKEKVLSYFDAEDEVFTRVVETVSLTATLAKASVPSPKVDHEKVVTELLKLMPELTEQVNALIKAATTMTEPKSPALRVKLGEDVATAWNTLIKAAGGLLSKVKSWATGYDRKLAKIKAMMNPVTEAAEKWVYSSEGQWKSDCKEFGYTVKHTSGTLSKGDMTWTAYENGKVVGKFTEEEEGRGGWLQQK